MILNKILLATRNIDKVTEIRQVLNGLDIEILSANDIDGLPEVVEDKSTLEGNAIKKASVLSKISGLPALADDTGLEVEALNGQPGVFSSRFAGEGASYEDNVQKLLRDLKGTPSHQRKAQFRTVIAFVYKDTIATVDGICKGQILEEKRGDSGFGYDPIFYVPEFSKTFSEMSLELKNKISHRGLALHKFRNYFVTNFGA